MTLTTALHHPLYVRDEFVTHVAVGDKLLYVYMTSGACSTAPATAENLKVITDVMAKVNA